MSTYGNGGDVKPRIVDEQLEFDPDAGPALRGESLDDFLRWAGDVPVGAKEAIRARIAAARDDAGLLDALLKELWMFPVNDGGRHGVV